MTKVWAVVYKSKVGIEPHPGWIVAVFKNHDEAIRVRDEEEKAHPYDDWYIREWEVR